MDSDIETDSSSPIIQKTTTNNNNDDMARMDEGDSLQAEEEDYVIDRDWVSPWNNQRQWGTINQYLQLDQLLIKCLHLTLLIDSQDGRHLKRETIIDSWESNSDDRISLLLVCKHWCRLLKSTCTQLIIYNSNIDSIMVNLNSFPSLRTLDIVGDEWTENVCQHVLTRVFQPFQPHPTLQELNLSNISLDDAIITDWLNQYESLYKGKNNGDGMEIDNNNNNQKVNLPLVKLNTLDVSSNPIYDQGVSDLCKLISDYNIRVSNLNLQSLESADGLEFVGGLLTDNTNILSLNWNYNVTDYNSAMSLSNGLRSNSTIQYLYLKGCDIEGWGALSLGDTIKINHSIRYLDISDNMFGDRGVLNLAEKLLENNTLTHLDVSGNCVSTIGISSLFNTLKTNKTITYLNISKNSFDSVDLQNVESLSNNNTLETLLMSSCNISNHHLDIISDAISKNKHLVKLDLSLNVFNNINPFLNMLSKNSTLSTLLLSKISIDEQKLYVLLHYLKKFPFGCDDQAYSTQYHIPIERMVHGLKYVNVAPKTAPSSFTQKKIRDLMSNNNNNNITIKYS